MIFSRCGAEKR